MTWRACMHLIQTSRGVGGVSAVSTRVTGPPALNNYSEKVSQGPFK